MRPQRGRRWKTWVLVVGGPLVLVFLARAFLEKPPAGSRLPAWKEYSGNPILRIGQQKPSMVWNDPSVLKEGGEYRMWLTGGDPSDLKHIVVSVYRATSKDGTAWSIDPDAIVTPGPQQWDNLRIETPTVIHAGSVYHMYYGGADAESAAEGRSAIGHATSTDGVHWAKDPANPVLQAQTDDRFRWGYGGVGEPAALYNPRNQRIYLYYVSMRFSRKEPTIGNIAILLATSSDGTKFQTTEDGAGEARVILTRDIPNATKGAWFGYSTPCALITNDGRFHLFASLLVAPKGPPTARHVTLAHATGDDGLNFRTQEDPVFEAGKGDWKDQQVRSPSVIEDGGRLRMWLAGESRKPFYHAGIGVASRDPESAAAGNGR